MNNNMVKIPNLRETGQLAIYRHDPGVELGSTEKQPQLSGQGISLGNLFHNFTLQLKLKSQLFIQLIRLQLWQYNSEDPYWANKMT